MAGCKDPWCSRCADNLGCCPSADRIHSWAKAHAFDQSLPSQQDSNRSQATTTTPGVDPSVSQHAQVNPPVGASSAATATATTSGGDAAAAAEKATEPSQDNNNADDKQPAEEGKPGLFVRMKNGSVRFVGHTRTAICHSWVNVLLIFVPAGIAVAAAGLNPVIIFALNAVAIIPLAGLLSHATECVASRLGDTIGALINVTFGNAVELIILYVFFSVPRSVWSLLTYSF